MQEEKILKQEGRLYSQALNLALGYLSRRSRTEYEIAVRLSQRGYEWEVTARVMDCLRERGLVNDLEYGIRYAGSRFSSSPRGRYALARELKQRGINEQIIESCLEKISPEAEYGAAFALACKIRERKGEGYSLANIAFALKSRGFAGNVVYSVCRSLEDSEIADKS